MGDANQNIVQAIQFISEIKNINITKQARFYLSKAWGKTDQSDFVNTVIEIECTITPDQLLSSIQHVEKQMGRIRKEKWGPRIIDIDILTYEDCVVNQPHLKIPHPHITERSFVLAPLYELNQTLWIANKGPIEKFIDNKIIDKEIILSLIHI